MRPLVSLLITTFISCGSSLAVAQDAEPEPGAPGADEQATAPAKGENEDGETAPAPAAKNKPLPGDDVDEHEPEPPLVPSASDTLSGHVTVAPSLALVVPFGKLESGLPQSDMLSIGAGFGVDLGIGVSRTVALGAFGQFFTFGSSDNCVDCSATSLAFGAFVRYHLVQGVRFDPWMAAGIGYRTTKIDLGPSEHSYAGVEWLRLQIGGDWYPARLLGFGPFLELDMGTFNDHPDASREVTLHWHLLAGLRIVLDVPGK